MSSLNNKKIFITGASGLVGISIIKRLLKEGAEIHYCGRNEILNLSSNKIYFYKTDLNSEQSINDLLYELSSTNIGFNGFVHCAWSRPSQLNPKSKESFFLESVNNNSRAIYLLSEFFTQNLVKNDESSIIFIGSIYGVVAPDFEIYEGTEMHTELDYQFLKHGINGLSKYYASLYGRYGLRSNVIILGGVENNQPDIFTKKYIKKTTLKRMATPNDVAGPVAFLLSDDSNYITGSLVMVDGGYTSK